MCGSTHHAERGTTTTEYALLVAGLVAALLVVTGVMNPALTHLYETVLCRIAGRCDTTSGEARVRIQPWDSADPLVRATWGDMVVMGDSYASGEGDGAYGVAGSSPGCHASARAGGPTAARRLGMDQRLYVVACTGAATASDGGSYRAHHQPPQVDALGDRTSLVTLSIGGNDLNWGATIAACAAAHTSDDVVGAIPRAALPERLRPATRTCADAFDTTVSDAISALGPRLDRTYAAVRDRAPRARVLVTGYPRFFPTVPTHELMADGKVLVATPAEQAWMNRKTADANRAIAEAAARAGFEFVDVEDAFDGHELTTDSPWMFGADLSLGVPPRESHDFHPSETGQARLGALIEQHVRNPTNS